MGCVDIKSKWFKSLAEHYNIDTLGLEQIVHKYWLETGKEDSFPSEAYIYAQMGKTQYLESMPTIRDLWEKSYSEPKIFTNEAEYNIAWVRAMTYFPKETLVH